MLNYFVTLNERGANTSEELARQRAKLIEAVLGLDSDVLGLMEIENIPPALDDFVASINAAAGTELYRKADDPAFLGTDAIRTAIIYKPSRVQAVGGGLSDDDAVFSRPPIAQTFSRLGNKFSVVVNHFKSKGSCPSDASDVNADFGQGCWNALRVDQASALLCFIDELKVASGDEDVVVLGDLNSYLGEDPIQTLQSGGLVNHILNVPMANRYSYVFMGESGVLDYGMSTPSLSLSGVDIWHINADEPRLLDYNQEFNPVSAYQPNAYRSSDHDPVVLGFELPAYPAQMTDEWIEKFKLTADTLHLRIADRVRILVRAELAQRALALAERPQTYPAVVRASLKVAKQQLTKTKELVDSVKGSNAAELGQLSKELAQIIAGLD